MSAKLMGQVWELALSANHQIVLLALADHARDDGSSVYPSIEYLAWKTGYSERSVQRILRELEDAEIITAVHGHAVGRGHKTVYQIHLEKGDKKTPFHAPKWCQDDTIKKGDILSKGDKPRTEKVTNGALKGDKPGNAYKAEPLVEPSVLTVSSTRARRDAVNFSETPQKNSRTISPDLQRAILVATCKLKDWQRGTISSLERQTFDKLFLKLSEDERTPDDVATYLINFAHSLGSVPEKINPPTAQQMLRDFDRYLNFKAREVTDERLPARVANDDAAAKRFLASRGAARRGERDALPHARRSLPAATD